VPEWPAWCYLPLPVVDAVLSKEFLVNIVVNVESERRGRLVSERSSETLREPSERDRLLLGALAAWRRTKGIYCFDPSLTYFPQVGRGI
jgi:hypothetical protein